MYFVFLLNYNRYRIFSKKYDVGKERMASPTNVVLGTFMLWWGWLGVNCGSTFGVSGGYSLLLFISTLK